MLTTVNDLCHRLKQLDEVTLLELLHIRSDEIVERFEDVIIRKSFELREELTDLFDEDPEEEDNDD
jgi:hypothetical protein